MHNPRASCSNLKLSFDSLIFMPKDRQCNASLPKSKVIAGSNTNTLKHPQRHLDLRFQQRRAKNISTVGSEKEKEVFKYYTMEASNPNQIFPTSASNTSTPLLDIKHTAESI